MAMKVAVLEEWEKLKLRNLDAWREVASGGHPGLSPEECQEHVAAYMAFVEELHEAYDLDEGEMYTFDQARGIIYEGVD